jgi:hypothetical protein
MNIFEVIAGKTITLNRLYGGNFPDRYEDFWDHVRSHELDKELPVRVLPAFNLKLLLTSQYRKEDIDEVSELLNDGQRDIINRYQKDPQLSSKIIVLSGNRIVDGNHRALAAALNNVSINYVDLADLDEQDVTEDSLNEVSKDWRERSSAEDKIGKIASSRERSDQFTIDDINEVKRLIKITGRASVIYGGKEYNRLGTAGGILDHMIHNYRLNQAKSGAMPQFTGVAANARDMARQIAMQTNGDYNQKYARVWTTGYGQRYKDPSDFVEYKTEEDYDSAWDWVQSKGKKVYYYDNFKHLNTAIKIGRYIVEPASVTRGVFSGNPETTHQLSVRTAAVINQAVRRQADISDQQAMALKDIAATKNANALEGLKLLMSVLKGEEDIKSVIDNSKKLDPKDKAKLDAIIAGAKNFKEPDQDIAEARKKKRKRKVNRTPRSITTGWWGGFYGDNSSDGEGGGGE